MNGLALQVQEAMKLIHGLPTLAGHGYIFEGLNHTSYVVEYTANADCMSHYTFGRLTRLNERSCDLTLGQLRERARQAGCGLPDLGRPVFPRRAGGRRVVAAARDR